MEPMIGDFIIFITDYGQEVLGYINDIQNDFCEILHGEYYQLKSYLEVKEIVRKN